MLTREIKPLAISKKSRVPHFLGQSHRVRQGETLADAEAQEAKAEIF